MSPVMRWVAVACGVLLAGAGLGFVARELLGLERPAVAIAWVVGVAAGLTVELDREREPRPSTPTAARVDDAVRRCRLNAGPPVPGT